MSRKLTIPTLALMILLLPLTAKADVLDPACTTTGLAISMTAELGAVGGPLALLAQHGAMIVYTVTQVRLPSSTDCPVTDGTVSVTIPGGSTYVLATGVALGGAESRSKAIGGSVSYVADHADEISVATWQVWRAAAGIAATRHLGASGLEGPATATTTYDTISDHPPQTTTTRHHTQQEPPVGGILLGIDMLALLAPVLTIVAALTIAAGLLLVSRRKQR